MDLITTSGDTLSPQLSYDANSNTFSYVGKYNTCGDYTSKSYVVDSIQEQIDAILKKEDKGAKMEEKINKMLKDYTNKYIIKINKQRKKEVDAIIEKDENVKIIAAAKEDLFQKLISANTTKFGFEDYDKYKNNIKNFLDENFDKMTVEQKIRDYYTLDTMEKINELDLKYDEEIKDFSSIIGEVKIYISLVENFEQALEILKSYNIIDVNNRMYFPY